MTKKGIAVAGGSGAVVATGVGVAVAQNKEVKGNEVEAPKPIVFKEEKADTYFLLKNDAANAISKLLDDTKRGELIKEVRTNPSRERLKAIIKESKEKAVSESTTTDPEFSWSPVICCRTRTGYDKWGAGNITMRLETPFEDAPTDKEFEELTKRTGKVTLESYDTIMNKMTVTPPKENPQAVALTKRPARWKPESERPKPNWPKEDYVLRKNSEGKLELIKRTW